MKYIQMDCENPMHCLNKLGITGDVWWWQKKKIAIAGFTARRANDMYWLLAMIIVRENVQRYQTFLISNLQTMHYTVSLILTSIKMSFEVHL